jgi:hypothetical protein
VVGGSNPLGPTSRKPSSDLEEGFLIAIGGPHRARLVVTLVVTGTSGSTLTWDTPRLSVTRCVAGSYADTPGPRSRAAVSTRGLPYICQGARGKNDRASLPNVANTNYPLGREAQGSGPRLRTSGGWRAVSPLRRSRRGRAVGAPRDKFQWCWSNARSRRLRRPSRRKTPGRTGIRGWA